ncbi:MAG: hypothetical protein GWO16_05140 [Gammaproteobacteria bacterium]|nr:hypothetical protein [Gammaproteobacteria bacterium]NIR97462.1 hypothetical protein [Gammaproteobacteria bacterium]NIT63087.1 hypothetical protein [Gammaproteobacteria bacterium]NIV20049.1 hypothetical protein [Gammaproteobacteria bacterium]NIX10157.1 hypothetical protein [Gammaproteobacteria bacterium]
MASIADFTDNETSVVEQTLQERYGCTVPVEPADSEIRLHPTDRELTLCPILYWGVGDCHFVIIKTGDKRYRCQFFYRVHEQYGTGIDQYDDLAECTVSLLQSQADHESRQTQPSAAENEE